MEKIIINNYISLIPYYDNYELALSWYQDSKLCKQVDNIDYLYDKDMLMRMYNALKQNKFCFYIEYRNNLIGDATLTDNDEISIVISNPYQNKGIGKVVVKEIINLAKEDNRKNVKANIYSFNKQSQKMFESVGFRKFEDEWYIFEL